MARTLFRILLAAYPSSFRREYGPDMEAAFARAARAAGDGVAARTRFALAILRDAGKTLPRAWWGRLAGHRRIPSLPDREASFMTALSTEIRYAVRRLALRPGLAIISVLALGLGIGLTTAMFSIVNGVLLVGLPFEEPQEILSILRVNPGQSQAALVVRIQEFEDLRERQTTLEDMGAMELTPVNVSPAGQTPEFVQGARVTASLFTVLAVEPEMGRGFTAEETAPGGAAVAVVGHRFWQEHLGGDPRIVSRQVRVNGVATTIVGVMPPHFEFPFQQQIWLPLQVDADALPPGESPPLLGVGRLRDGVTLQQARADLDRIMQQLAEERPDTNEGMALQVGPYTWEIIGRQLPPFLFTMLGAVSLVLLIACANVANLLLARASLRSKEVAISAALGAARRRLFGQLLAEASLVAVLGAGLGIGVAAVGIDRFNQTLANAPQGLPFWFAIGIDPTVLGFVVVITVAASLLSGVMPAIQASGADVNEILKDSARGGSSLRMGRLSRGLVIAEVALSCALLIGAALMVKSIVRLAADDFAFDQENVFTAQVNLPTGAYADPGSWRRFWSRLEPRLDAIPGVRDAALGSDLPVVGFTNGRVAIEGREYVKESDYPSARIGAVDPDYFPTLRTPIVEGRGFTAADAEDSVPVAIVNRSFVRSHFADRSPLGERVSIRGIVELGTSDRDDTIDYTIVGVVPDLYQDTDLIPNEPDAVYVPLAQRPSSAVNLVLRTDGPPLEATAAVRRAVADLDSDLPISGVNTLAQAIDDQGLMLRLFSILFAICGGAALFLAAVGLYGVLSFSVNQRLHEVGIRVALGAGTRDVVRMVVGQGLRQVGVGLVIGLLMAFGLSRLLAVALYRVSPTDPVVFAGIALVLLGTGVLACAVPARRAIRVNAIEAMRTE